MTKDVEKATGAPHSQIEYLNDLVMCHRDAAQYLRSRINSETTEFQHIILDSHGSVAVFLRDSLFLIRNGSLASSSVLLRPVAEILLEMHYLKCFPTEVKSYFGKVNRHYRQNSAGKTSSRPRETLRFKPIEEIANALTTPRRPSPDQYATGLVDQWKILADAAAHPSAQILSAGKGGREWDSTLGTLERISFDAIRQLFEIDKELERLIDQRQEFRRKVLNLSFRGSNISTGLSDNPNELPT